MTRNAKVAAAFYEAGASNSLVGELLRTRPLSALSRATEVAALDFKWLNALRDVDQNEYNQAMLITLGYQLQPLTSPSSCRRITTACSSTLRSGNFTRR